MKLYTLLALIALSSVAGAQTVLVEQAPTVTATGTPTACSGSCAPSITIASSGAASCTINGATAPVNGVSASATITLTTTYTVSCSAPVDTSAALSWVAPAANTDGSTPVNLSGYNIQQQDCGAMTLAACDAALSAQPDDRSGGIDTVGGAILNSPTGTSYTLSGLAVGVHGWKVNAWGCNTTPCQLSGFSGNAYKQILATPPVTTKSFTVTVVAALSIPGAPTGTTVH